MIRCDTEEERKALKDLTFACWKMLTTNRGEVKAAREHLQVCYDRLADTAIGIRKVSGSERYHRG